MFKLFKRHVKYKIKIFILFLIKLIEKYEFRKYDLNEDDISKKIIESVDIDDYLIETDSGWQPITQFHKTQPYKIWEITTSSNKHLEAADNHILFNENYNEIFIKDLQIGSKIITKDGIESIKSIKQHKHKVSMFDVTVDSIDHRYWSNDILSHNTITSSIFLLWFLIFNYEKNVFLLANKGATTKEIMDKIRQMSEFLPFFLKPGVIKKDVTAMNFDNKCRIITQNTTRSSGIGFTIHLLYLDEFAHIQEQIKRPFYENIYPTLSSSKISRVIITSTPNGFDLFHELYNNALDGLNEYKPIRVDWWEVPGRDDKWRELEIANLGSEEAFNQQYGSQFLSTSSLLLSSEHILRLERNKQKFVFREFDALDDAYIDYSNLKWSPDFDVDLIKSPSNYYFMSIDLAEGLNKDYTVLNIFQLQPISKSDIEKTLNFTSIDKFFGLKQIGVFKSNTINIEEFSKILYNILVKIFDPENTRVALEYNLYGSELIKNLSTIYGASNNFDEEVFIKYHHRIGAISKRIGIKYGKENKIFYAETLREAVDKGRIILQDEDTVEESKSFSRNKNGTFSAQSGHDDLIMSCVTISSALDTLDFSEYVEEFYDTLDDEYTKLIEEKYELVSSDELNIEDYYDIF